MYVLRNNEARSCDHCCSGKAVSFTHSECVFVALGIQHVKRVLRIVIRGLPGSTVIFFFFKFSHKPCDFRETLLKTKCMLCFSLQLLSETFLILRRTERDMIMNVYRSACKVPVIDVRL